MKKKNITKSKLFIGLHFVFFSIMLCAQSDSINKNEVSIGVPIAPVLYNGINTGPVLRLESMKGNNYFLSSLNVSYKININERKRIRTGISFFRAPGYFSESRFTYYLLLNTGLERTMVTDEWLSINYGYDLLLGYWKLYDYEDSSLDIEHLNSFLFGPDLGISFKFNMGKKWFLECETYYAILISYNTGNIDYHINGSGYQPTKNYFWDGNFIFSKLLGFNLGYKL